MNFSANFASIACATVLLVGACTSVDDDEKSAAQAAVKQQLRDPGSAQFSNETVVWNRDASGSVTDVAVCGWVNSKNMLGGYTGNARYVATTDSDVLKFTRVKIEANVPAEVFEIYWNASCASVKKASG